MRKLIVRIWIGLLALFIAEGALAQRGLNDLPPGKWWTNRRVIAQLKLTPDQQSRIDALWTQNRRSLIAQKAELDKRQLELLQLLGRDSIDEAAALKAFDRLQEAKQGIERSTFLMRVQIKNLLSAEQQQQLETISELLREQQAKAGNIASPASATPSINKKEITPIKKQPR